MSSFAGKSVGEIVVEEFRAAALFKEAGIDFCCGGRQSLEEACGKAGIDPVQFSQKLENLTQGGTGGGENFDSWDLDLLASYIVKKHHRYARKTIPDLLFYTQKLAAVHGGRHPELIEVAELFRQVSDELLPHMKEEEEVLFPAIEAVLERDPSAKEVISREIGKLIPEHESAGGAMEQIRKISDGYRVPDDGCNTYRVGYQLLEEFEDDLHLHIHLENNILFPKALQL